MQHNWAGSSSYPLRNNWRTALEPKVGVRGRPSWARMPAPRSHLPERQPRDRARPDWLWPLRTDPSRDRVPQLIESPYFEWEQDAYDSPRRVLHSPEPAILQRNWSWNYWKYSIMNLHDAQPHVRVPGRQLTYWTDSSVHRRNDLPEVSAPLLQPVRGRDPRRDGNPWIPDRTDTGLQPELRLYNCSGECSKLLLLVQSRPLWQVHELIKLI